MPRKIIVYLNVLKGELETDFGILKPFISQFKNWNGVLNSWPCGGKFDRFAFLESKISLV